MRIIGLPGKPVNFVPVVDKDVRRWWRSDSLWQAHDARYSADQVCIIPGTVAFPDESAYAVATRRGVAVSQQHFTLLGRRRPPIEPGTFTHRSRARASFA